MTQGRVRSCSVCSGLAEIILQTAADDLDITTRKIKVLCAEEIQSAALDGRLLCDFRRPRSLYGIARSIRNYLHIDCEENEGYNSLVRMERAFVRLNLVDRASF